MERQVRLLKKERKQDKKRKQKAVLGKDQCMNISNLCKNIQLANSMWF